MKRKTKIIGLSLAAVYAFSVVSLANYAVGHSQENTVREQMLAPIKEYVQEADDAYEIRNNLVANIELIASELNSDGLSVTGVPFLVAGDELSQKLFSVVSDTDLDLKECEISSGYEPELRTVEQIKNGFVYYNCLIPIVYAGNTELVRAIDEGQRALPEYRSALREYKDEQAEIAKAEQAVKEEARLAEEARLKAEREAVEAAKQEAEQKRLVEEARLAEEARLKAEREAVEAAKKEAEQERLAEEARLQAAREEWAQAAAERERANAERKAEQERKAEAIRNRVTEATAMTACQIYGRMEFPWGFENVSGLFKAELEVGARGNSQRVARNVVVTNGFGTKVQRRMECLVGGTDNNPVIEAFRVS